MTYVYDFAPGCAVAPNSLAGNPNPGNSVGTTGKSNYFGVYPDNTNASITVVPGASGYLPNKGLGAYQYNRLFQSSVDGVWVQRIQLINNVFGPPDGKLQWTTVVTFYEAFPTGPGNLKWDQFNTPSFPRGFSGTYTVSGEAQFYPGATMTDFPELRNSGFTGHVPYSGYAPSSYIMPANWWPSAGGATKANITVGVPNGGLK